MCAGDEVIIDNGSPPVAVLRNPPSPVPARTLSETIARMKASSEQLGYTPVMDDDYAADMGEIIANRKPRIGMGLILDTTILIASERSGGTPDDILKRARDVHGKTVIAFSAITVVELTHGI